MSGFMFHTNPKCLHTPQEGKLPLLLTPLTYIHVGNRGPCRQYRLCTTAWMQEVEQRMEQLPRGTQTMYVYECTGRELLLNYQKLLLNSTISCPTNDNHPVNVKHSVRKRTPRYLGDGWLKLLLFWAVYFYLIVY